MMSVCVYYGFRKLPVFASVSGDTDQSRHSEQAASVSGVTDQSRHSEKAASVSGDTDQSRHSVVTWAEM